MIESFYHAFHGVKLGFAEQRNVRIHLALTCLAVAFGFYLGLDTVSWLSIVLSIGMVLTAEFLNTAVEHLVNLSADGKYHELARSAKDTAAAAVLFASATAAIVGLLVFVPRLIDLI
jgi:undecaprenol kinase